MTSGNDVKTVMAIAGLDPSGGAGLLADIKTISAFGCYGVGAATSLTFQNTKGVFGARHATAAEIRAQVEPLVEDFSISAVKTGMLPTVESVETVAEIVAGIMAIRPGLVFVIDPVAVSSSGHSLVEDGALDAAAKLLFPFATVVTPNCDEASLLSGIAVNDLETMERAAEKIRAGRPNAVLVTGGDLEGDLATDALVDQTGLKVYSAPRIQGPGFRGTGCTLASALACLLSRGKTVRDSVEEAKEYVVRAMLSAPRVAGGRQPLAHCPNK
jgi:hydroxymethylpyrimidine kinase/phosphomethylpyrimidine kinase